MKSIKAFRPIAAGLVVLACASCTMKQDIHIEKSGSGTVVMDAALADYLTEVIIQIQMLLQPENPIDPDAPFFDIEAIQADFEQREGMSLLRLEAPTRNSFSGEFAFDDVEQLFQRIEEGSPESRLIRFRERDGISSLEIRITRETVEELLDSNPSLNNPLMANFGPATTKGLSESDYLDMMEFALGSESRRGLQESFLLLNINVEGRILEQTGGRLIDENTVQYRVPILPFLMLKEPLVYTLSYR